jgi:hypothetical protein
MSDSPEVTNSGKAVVRPVGDKQIEVVREFDAPRHLVFRAYTEPELIKRWWAGRPAPSPSPRSTCGSAATTATR